VLRFGALTMRGRSLSHPRVHFQGPQGPKTTLTRLLRTYGRHYVPGASPQGHRNLVAESQNWSPGPGLARPTVQPLRFGRVAAGNQTWSQKIREALNFDTGTAHSTAQPLTATFRARLTAGRGPGRKVREPCSKPEAGSSEPAATATTFGRDKRGAGAKVHRNLGPQPWNQLLRALQPQPLHSGAARREELHPGLQNPRALSPQP
jgi:hypothetical protein